MRHKRSDKGDADPAPEPHNEMQYTLVGLAVLTAGRLIRHRIAGRVKKEVRKRAVEQLAGTGLIGRKLGGAVLGKLASRSVPGAVVLGAGLAGKALVDRARTRSKSGVADPQGTQADKENNGGA